MIVTIDGPAGSGKSTAARQLARRLGVAHLDTGATYRAATLAALEAGTDLTDERALAELVAGLDIRLAAAGKRTGVLLNGRDVTGELRGERVSAASYYLARAPAVREVLVPLQRRMGAELSRRTGGVVTEGRDQGTVVFPDADVKIYLDADPAVRARRRAAELRAAGEEADERAVLDAIRVRDERDRTRDVGPLTRPDDAVVVDTSHRTIEQTAEELVRQVRART